MTTWDEVQVGDTLRLRGGVEWVVVLTTKATKSKPRTVTVERLPDGKRHTGSPTGEVEIVSRGAPAIPGVDPSELAVAVVQTRIGGEKILETVPGSHFASAPKAFQSHGSLLAHLYTAHGVREWPQKDAVAALHERLHDENAPFTNGVDHVHE